jgi:hypothetical protein
MLTKEDIICVADRLHMCPQQGQIEYVLEHFEGGESSDPTATWDLIVENLLYECAA